MFQGLFQDSGALIGSYFATGFTAALATVTTALNALIAALNQLDVATGITPVTISTPGTGDNPLGAQDPTHPHYARGGKVPGLVARGDTVAARLTPGEYVIDRKLTAQLQDYLDAGDSGGINVTVNNHFHKSVLGLDERRLAKQITPAIQSELDRIVRSRDRRG